MELHVGLSGEHVDDRAPRLVRGVGLLRGEYVFRRIRRYLRDPGCARYLRAYLRFVLRRFPNQPVWYRFCDAPSTELNLLRGRDAYILEEFAEVGIRGMRRAMQFSASFESEFQIVADVAREHPNLGVIFPYVTEMNEVIQGLDAGRRCGFTNPYGVMIETPAAVYHARDIHALGIRHFLVGMNDLKSLVIGTGRGSGFDRHDHPAIIGTLTSLRKLLVDSTLAVAGYHSGDFWKVAERIGFDHFVAHYWSLPEVIGPQCSSFREIGHMARFKKEDYRRRLHEWSRALYERSCEEDWLDRHPTRFEIVREDGCMDPSDRC